MDIGLKITTEILLQGALLFAAIDLLLVPLLVWRVRPALFQHMQPELLGVTAVFWCGLWFWAISYYWESVYRYLFPLRSRWLLPFLMAALTTSAAAMAWRLARRSQRFPTAAYLLLGGLWGSLTHIWAVYVGVVDKPPMLQGASPIAAVIVAFFEFMLYWCVIVAVAALLRRARK